MGTRSWVIVAVVLVVLVAIAAGTWWWLGRGGPRPLVEVIVAEAPVKIGTKVIATAKKGDRLPVFAKRVGWYQVRAQGRTGWIYAGHIRRVGLGKKPVKGPVQVEILSVHFPRSILREFPPVGERWALIEAQAYALDATARGVCVVDTHRFVLARGKSYFYRPRYWKTIPVGDHTIDRLETRDTAEIPVGSTRRFRLAFAVPLDLVTQLGWRLYYVRKKPDAPATATPAQPATAAPPTSRSP